mmetsp:Transcript_24108/g.59824  ORF Transcript_24108/g.59824 Transcript_24108/m.59824 type:complete len:240 (-) Transcript_24108:1552-2271(-)
MHTAPFRRRARRDRGHHAAWLRLKMIRGDCQPEADARLLAPEPHAKFAASRRKFEAFFTQVVGVLAVFNHVFQHVIPLVIIGVLAHCNKLGRIDRLGLGVSHVIDDGRDEQLNQLLFAREGEGRNDLQLTCRESALMVLIGEGEEGRHCGMQFAFLHAARYEEDHKGLTETTMLAPPLTHHPVSLSTIMVPLRLEGAYIFNCHLVEAGHNHECEDGRLEVGSVALIALHVAGSRGGYLV